MVCVGVVKLSRTPSVFAPLTLPTSRAENVLAATAGEVKLTEKVKDRPE